MKKYLFIIGALLLLPISVHAANASITIDSSKKDVNLNSTITVNVNISSNTAIGYYEYTLDYDHSKLKLSEGNPYNVNKSDNNNTKDFTKSFKFKVIAEGKSKISVKSYTVNSYKNDERMKVTVKPLTINSKKNNSNSLSNNNYLSSLKVDGYSISPKFDKNNTNYVLKINEKIDKINISANAEDSKATVSGIGKQYLEEGENKIEIVVTSEKGEDKTYTINVTMKEADPIIVTIDDAKYTVLRNIGDIDIPKGYEIKKIKINDEEIEALYSNASKLTLVALKDSDENVSLYIYDENDKSYKPYSQITTDSISFLPVETNKELKGYTLYKETINGIEVNCYKISEDSNYCVIYGQNLNTKNEDWYVYDLEENTIQKYNDYIDNYYNEKMKNTKILIYILSGTTLVFGITTIALAIKSSRKR